MRLLALLVGVVYIAGSRVDLGMAESFLYVSHISSGFDQHRRMSMPQCIEVKLPHITYRFGELKKPNRRNERRSSW